MRVCISIYIRIMFYIQYKYYFLYVNMYIYKNDDDPDSTSSFHTFASPIDPLYPTQTPLLTDLMSWISSRKTSSWPSWTGLLADGWVDAHDDYY